MARRAAPTIGRRGIVGKPIRTQSQEARINCDLRSEHRPVTDTTSIEIPKPLDWQDFQRKCVVLFQCVVEDPRLQEWGRGGQLQDGIDLLGCRNEDPARPIGIQCRRIKSQLTADKMRTDVQEARAIQPPLVEFIFATTAPRDSKIQQAALKITHELMQSGWKCRVLVMAWEDLQLEIGRHTPALRAFFPQAVSDSATLSELNAAIDHGTNVVKINLQQQTATILERLDDLQSGRMILPALYDPDLEPEAASEPILIHSRITTMRELINGGRTKTAIERLQLLLEQEAPLPPYAQYRVISNIAAAHFYADRPKQAHKYFEMALALRPNDPKAQVNLAYAELALDRAGDAIVRAEMVLSKDANNGSAASIVIQARKADAMATDPFALVPAAVHEKEEVLCAAIIFLRRRDDCAWYKLAVDAHLAHPSNSILKQYAAEAIMQPLISDQAILLGKPADHSVFDRVKASAELLRGLWRAQLDSEEVTADAIVPLAHNCAVALRFVDRSSDAAWLLDRTLEKVGPDPALVRTRVLLHLHADEEQQAVALIEAATVEPELALMAVEIMAARQPEAAMQRLQEINLKKAVGSVASQF